jgi:hypothetical protein
METAEQFVLWALRQRLADGRSASPTLVHGFRLAFGLGSLELALAAFEHLFRTLSCHLRRELGLCPLRCACVSVDEEVVLSLVAAAQADDEARLWTASDHLVEPAACRALCDHATTLASLLRLAALDLPQRTAHPTVH